ncbi:MAG: preprotein translocase subunit SecG [Hyphomicrobiales bacterium]|nr:preprotein translocase subunit SecG [Hyphomicrobiales bacterium]
MQTVLLVIHLLVVIALVAVVLLQRSEGGALGAGGGGGFMTGRGQANALSRATAILGALFFATALAMSIIASWSRTSQPLIDSAAPAATHAPDAQKPQGSLLDQLKQMQSPAAPAAPSAPAPAAPAQEPPK